MNITEWLSTPGIELPIQPHLAKVIRRSDASLPPKRQQNCALIDSRPVKPLVNELNEKINTYTVVPLKMFLFRAVTVSVSSRRETRIRTEKHQGREIESELKIRT